MDYSPSSVLVVVLGAGYVFLRDGSEMGERDLVQIWTKGATPKIRKIFVSYDFDPKVKIKGQIFLFAINHELLDRFC